MVTKKRGPSRVIDKNLKSIHYNPIKTGHVQREFHGMPAVRHETLAVGGSFYYQLFFLNLSMCSNRFSMCLCVKNGFSKTVRNHRLFLYFGKERKKSVSFTK